jgi:hypothetical protein
MSVAHLYLFSDASPSDWLVDGQDETWHTIANFVFQSDPQLQVQVESGKLHTEVLPQDAVFKSLIADIERQLPSGHLAKWKIGPAYRSRFCRAIGAALANHQLVISACSFQEKMLRASQAALLHSYNAHIGGIEGRGIGFEDYLDGKGRSCMKHSFVNFTGYHEIKGLKNQLLVLLFMSWFVADQYVFFRKQIVDPKQLGFDQLGVTVVSDKLSGDDDFRRSSEENLRNLIDPDREGVPIILTRSPKSDTFSGDLLVDNFAGWLNSAISDPTGEPAQYIQDIASSGIWAGWHELIESSSKLESVSALSRLGLKSAS